MKLVYWSSVTTSSRWLCSARFRAVYTRVSVYNVRSCADHLPFLATE